MSYPNKNYPTLKEDDWVILEKICGLTRKQIEGIINTPDIDPSLVSGTLYFTHKEKYQQIAPELFQKWKEIFN